MPSKLTASDRKSLIRLAASLPKGRERKALLDTIKKFFEGGEIHSFMKDLEKKFPNLEGRQAKALWESIRVPRGWRGEVSRKGTQVVLEAEYRLGGNVDRNSPAYRDSPTYFKKFIIIIGFVPLEGQLREDREEYYTLGGNVWCQSHAASEKGSPVSQMEEYDQKFPIVVSSDRRGRWEASREASQWIERTVKKLIDEIERSVERDPGAVEFPAYPGR
jgi:hypothetical protein